MDNPLIALGSICITLFLAYFAGYFSGKKVATADLTKEAFKEIDKKLTQQADQKNEDDKLIGNLRTMLLSERVRNIDKVSKISTATVRPKSGSH